MNRWNVLLMVPAPHPLSNRGVLFFSSQAITDMFEWKIHFERERATGLYSSTAYWLVR